MIRPLTNINSIYFTFLTPIKIQLKSFLKLWKLKKKIKMVKLFLMKMEEDIIQWKQLVN